MTDSDPYSGKLSDREYLRIMRLLEQTREQFDEQVKVNQSDPDWRMIASLVRGHISGNPVTISGLIQDSGIPYGTAQRRIHAMIDTGLIKKTFSSQTHKSFFLQPSPELLANFTAYITSMKALFARTFGVIGDEDADEFYFGGADFAREIAPPASLELNISESGEQLRFLLNDDNYFNAMRNMWADYRNNLGSRKDFKLEQLPDLHSELVSSLSLSDAKYDVVALNMPWLGEFVDAGQIRALDEYITKDNIQPLDFHSSVWSTGQWDESQYGIPIYVTVEAMAIRRDLFDSQEIDPPRTFDQVIDIGRRFNNPGKDFYGISWNAARGMPIASSFMILMGCCGAPIFNLPSTRRYHHWAGLTCDQLQPRIDCEEARIVLDYMQRLIEISPPDILEMNWDRRISAFKKGEVAMSYCWTMRASQFDRDPSSVVKRKARFIPQPKSSFGMSSNPIGGFLLAIPSNVPEERVKLAFEAISWMASPEAMKKYATNGLPVAPRFSVAADRDVSATSPIVGFVDTLAQRGMLCTWQRPPIPEFRQIESILGDRIHSALTRELSVNEALALAQSEVSQIMKRQGEA